MMDDHDIDSWIDGWRECHCCGGDIPPQILWGKPGEREDGCCPGSINPDGMCGAFGNRLQYSGAE
jgi:hypothetical protein